MHLEVSHLPNAGYHEDDNLCYAVPDRLGVRILAEVPKIRLSLALVLLFSSDVLELLIQVTQFRGELGHVRAVLVSVRLGASDDDIKVQTDVCGRTPRRVGDGGEADGVVAGFVRREREAAVVRPAGAHNIVARCHFLRTRCMGA